MMTTQRPMQVGMVGLGRMGANAQLGSDIRLVDIRLVGTRGAEPEAEPGRGGTEPGLPAPGLAPASGLPAPDGAPPEAEPAPAGAEPGLRRGTPAVRSLSTGSSAAPEPAFAEARNPPQTD